MEDNKLKIFIGSSSEAANNPEADKKYLRIISSIVRRAGAEPIAWDKSPSKIFKPGKSTFENLEESVTREDIKAAIFIYSKDDVTWSRGDIHSVVRDNVVFEHGLFSGVLGRTKAITVKIGNIKMPSDLYGITCIDYSKNPDDAELEICQWIADLKAEIDIITKKQNNGNSDIVPNNLNNLATLTNPITEITTTDETIKKSKLVELIPIKQGTYNRIIDNKEVKINHSFAISKYLITQSVYKAVFNDNPSNFKGDSLPIENVTFYEAIAFCNKLSELDGCQKVYSVNNAQIQWNKEVKGYRLPFEVEWEFALNYNSIEIKEKLELLAWYNNNSKNQTHKVGLKEQNRLEIYDLLGNVWEWCFDNFVDNPTIETIKDNYCIQNEDSTFRVLRGGSYADFETMFTKEKAFRKKEYENTKSRFIGFRVILQNI